MQKGLVFIGYHGSDEASARALALALQRDAVRVWCAAVEGTVRPGVPYWDQIQRVLDECEYALFVLRGSEIEKGLKKEIHYAETVWRRENEAHPRMVPVWLPGRRSELPLVLADLEGIELAAGAPAELHARAIAQFLGITDEAVDEPVSSWRSGWRWPLAAGTLAVAAFALCAVQLDWFRTPAPPPANESRALSTLRSIISAQAMFRERCAVDTDGDGEGEFGGLAELAGTVPCRQSGDAAAATALDPAMLPGVLGEISNSRASRAGYHYQVFLPARGTSAPMPEDAMGGFRSGRLPGSVESERMWCCYAWPVELSEHGRRIYFTNESGVILSSRNDGDCVYFGDHAPPADLAYRRTLTLDSELDTESSGQPDATGRERVPWRVMY